jgi:hypothetical protein
MNSQGIAVLNLRLSSISKAGDLFTAVNNYLEVYFEPAATDGGLHSLDLAFDINPTRFKDLEKHQLLVAKFVKGLCK